MDERIFEGIAAKEVQPDHQLTAGESKSAEQTESQEQMRRLIEDILQMAVLKHFLDDIMAQHRASGHAVQENILLEHFTQASLGKVIPQDETKFIDSLSEACRLAMDKTEFENKKKNIVRSTIDAVIHRNSEELQAIGYSTPELRAFVAKHFNIKAMVDMIIRSMRDVTHLTEVDMEQLINTGKI